MSKLKKFILITAFLVLLDQVVRVIVSRTMNVGIDSVKVFGPVYIRPTINDSFIRELVSIAPMGGFKYYMLFIVKTAFSLIIAASSCLFLWSVEKHFFSVIKKRSLLLPSIILISSSAICRVFDRINGGTLDYIGIMFENGVKNVGDHTHPLYSFLIFDIGDLYIWFAIITLVISLLLFYINLIRLDKSQKSELTTHFKSMFKKKTP